MTIPTCKEEILCDELEEALAENRALRAANTKLVLSERDRMDQINIPYPSILLLAKDIELELVGRAFTDLCDDLGCEYDNEASLEAIAALKSRVETAELALKKIIAIPNREYGPDWEEIEEARGIARSVIEKQSK